MHPRTRRSGGIEEINPSYVSHIGNPFPWPARSGSAPQRRPCHVIFVVKKKQFVIYWYFLPQDLETALGARAEAGNENGSEIKPFLPAFVQVTLEGAIAKREHGGATGACLASESSGEIVARGHDRHSDPISAAICMRRWI
jgi:hypothetical protein